MGVLQSQPSQPMSRREKKTFKGTKDGGKEVDDEGPRGSSCEEREKGEIEVRCSFLSRTSLGVGACKYGVV